jgi:hypothetical protein
VSQSHSLILIVRTRNFHFELHLCLLPIMPRFSSPHSINIRFTLSAVTSFPRPIGDISASRCLHSVVRHWRRRDTVPP